VKSSRAAMAWSSVPRRLSEFERRTDATELEPVHVLHDEHRRLRIRPELEDPHDPAIGKERKRARFAQKFRDARRHMRIPAHHLAGDDAIETKIAKLEDLAHAAGANALDCLKAVELGQWRVRSVRLRRGRPVIGQIAVERRRERHVLGHQRGQRLQEIRPIGAELVGAKHTAVENVLFDEAREQRLQLGGDRHGLRIQSGAG
jgi:hypothetical protein